MLGKVCMTTHLPPRPKKPKRAHCVENYNAKENIVDCSCGGFTGSDKEFYDHMATATGSKRRRVAHGGTLDFLLEMSKARSDYPSNGTLLSHRSYRD
jgi:hypothetical protein